MRVPSERDGCGVSACQCSFLSIFVNAVVETIVVVRANLLFLFFINYTPQSL